MFPNAPDPNEEVSRSKKLTEQAQAKAKKLDDGTEKGKLKGAVTLLLDRLRVINDTYTQFRAIVDAMGTDPGTVALKPQLEQIDADRQTVDAELTASLNRLEALGVKVNLVRRDGYR